MGRQTMTKMGKSHIIKIIVTHILTHKKYIRQTNDFVQKFNLENNAPLAE